MRVQDAALVGLMTPELLSPPHVTSSQTHLMLIYEKQDAPSIEYIKTRTSAPLLRNGSTTLLRGPTRSVFEGCVYLFLCYYQHYDYYSG